MFSKDQMYKSATPMKYNSYSKAGLKKNKEHASYITS